MTVSLSKGENFSLSKEDETLTKIHIGLGWDAHSSDGAAFDLDASVFMVKEDGKVRGDKDFIYYGNLKSPDGSVVHTGDNLTGEGEGDDEVVKVDLRIPADIAKLVFAVTIFKAKSRTQNFGMVSNAFIRIVNDENNSEIVRYDLSEDASTETAMIFGEIYRRGPEWKFRALEQGFAEGLGPLARSFGVEV